MEETVGLVVTGTFSANGEYLMSDYNTPEIAELRALDYARRNAAEQARIYLESYLRSVEFDEQGIKVKRTFRNYFVNYNDKYKHLATSILKRTNQNFAINFYEQSIKVYLDELYFYKCLAEVYKKLNQNGKHMK